MGKSEQPERQRVVLNEESGMPPVTKLTKKQLEELADERHGED